MDYETFVHIFFFKIKVSCDSFVHTDYTKLHCGQIIVVYTHTHTHTGSCEQQQTSSKGSTGHEPTACSSARFL